MTKVVNSLKFASISQLSYKPHSSTDHISSDLQKLQHLTILSGLLLFSFVYWKASEWVFAGRPERQASAQVEVVPLRRSGRQTGAGQMWSGALNQIKVPQLS